ncbi:hypothetical protein VTN77DRAFT_3195 [Rasamsonia byssochlamydoides]|uniref:uncharacterized protein n=1 Tax=Rasamsonia byssochlamydoides TaxID=89139 RepID=UPI003743B153
MCKQLTRIVYARGHTLIADKPKPQPGQESQHEDGFPCYEPCNAAKLFGESCCRGLREAVTWTIDGSCLVCKEVAGLRPLSFSRAFVDEKEYMKAPVERRTEHGGQSHTVVNEVTQDIDQQQQQQHDQPTSPDSQDFDDLKAELCVTKEVLRYWQMYEGDREKRREMLKVWEDRLISAT